MGVAATKTRRYTQFRSRKARKEKKLGVAGTKSSRYTQFWSRRV